MCIDKQNEPDNIYDYLRLHPVLITEDDVKQSMFLPDGFYLEEKDGMWSGWGPLNTLLTYSEPTPELAIRHTLRRLYFITQCIWKE